MGRIDRIVVENFKSYAGSQVIGPFREMTAVIGPNGAGKSNLMDAICFVLGLSARSLRGEKLKDLIWTPRSGAALSGPKPKTASVTMVYTTDEGDDRRSSRGTELAFQRSITAAGTSVYRVNAREVSLDAYVGALEEVGINMRARNFLVFQGDVEAIANKSAKDLLRHFEVFSGSDELRESYESAVKELADARLDASLKVTARKTTQTQRKDAKREKDEADLYVAKASERDRLRVQATLWKLYHIRERLEVETEGLRAAHTALAEAAEQEDGMTVESATLAKTLTRGNKELGAKEKAASTAERAFLKATTQAEEAVQHAAASTQRIEEGRARLDKLREQAATNAKDIAAVEADIAVQEQRLADIDNGVLPGETASAAASSKRRRPASGAPAPTLDAAARAEYNQLKAQERQRTAEQRQQLERLQREKLGDEAEASKLRSDVDGIAAQKDSLAKSIEDVRARIAELSAAATKIAAERGEKQTELQEARAQLEAAKQRQEALTGELEEVKGLLQMHKDARKKTDSDRRMEMALEDLKRSFPGVRGRLSDLVSPSMKKYNTAVSVALGKNMDAVVVDREAVAMECIAWLREHKVRPMTFIPLDTIVVKDVDDRLANMLNRTGSTYRLIRDVIRFDSELEAAVMYAVGSTVLCESLADARELRFTRDVSVKCITVDGTVVAKNGNMTGGSSSADAELARASRWDEKSLAAAQERRDTLLQEEELLRRKLNRTRTAVGDTTSLFILVEDCDAAVSNANVRLTMVKKQLDSQQALLAGYEKEMAALQTQLRSKQPALDAALAANQKRERTIAQLQQEMEALGDDVFAAFSRKLGLTSIRDFETEVLARAEAEARAKREVSDVLVKLRSKLAYEKSRDVSGQVSETRAAIATEEKRLADYRRKETEARRAMEEAKEAQTVAIDELEAARTTIKVAEAEKERISKARREIATQKANLSKNVAARESALERMSSQLHEVLQHAQSQCIQLPMRRGGVRPADSLDAESDDDGSTPPTVSPSSDARTGGVFSQSLSLHSESQTRSSEGTRGGVTAAQPLMPSDADLRRLNRIDFSGMAHDVNVPRDRVDDVSAQIERRIHDVELELSKLAPNMRAAAQLEEIERKLKQESRDADTARERQTEAERQFAQIRDARKRLFDDAFTHVASVIDVVYKDLTSSLLHPLGGRASLTIDVDHDVFDAECAGIRYNVMPPGKRFRELEQLSGGEKTVAALALLFALHSYRPAPFFVMDEVDAALDNVNVHKVASYIRRRALRQGRSSKAAPLQAIVISLKEGFYTKAAALVGVYRDSSADSSRSLTMDLEAFPASEAAAAAVLEAEAAAAVVPGSAARSMSSGIATPMARV